MRRRFLAIIMLCLNLALIPALNAHEGHDLSRIKALVGAVQQTEEGLSIGLDLINLRERQITLAAAYSELGHVTVEQLALFPGQVTPATVVIATPEQPSIFTLVLDFGAAGYGPITVIPSDH